MTIWGVTAGCLLLVAGVGACSSERAGAPTTTTTTRATTTSTAPERPTSTTTTTYAPTSVEGQVEAAYLKSWDVYADAVYNLHLDEAALAEVFTGEALEVRRNEIEQRSQQGRASLVRISHNYEITARGTTADVVDNFTNHQVLIDPDTKDPVEPDPDELLLVRFRLEQIEGSWKVAVIEKVTL